MGRHRRHPPLAISLIERRLKDAFPGIAFEVHGTPKDIDGARDLAARDKYQFQWWAVSLVDVVPQGGQKKGADRGIDGIRWVRTGPNERDMEPVLISVKGCDNVSVPMIRDLKGTMEREIMTIRELLAGMRPDLPPLGRSEGFRRAPRERGPQAKQTGLDL